uniref:Uncharacterized protein n=1 Tax=Clytia hemisphaerica TaxID=252671 RepID=A0A7M5UXH7_9CNID
GYTALHIAAMHGRENIIRKLVNDYAQNLDCRDYSGRKPKHYLDENSSRNIRCILSPVKKTDALDVPDANSIPNHKSISPRLMKNDHHKNEENKTRHRPTLSLSNSFKRTKKLLEKHSPGSSPIRRNKTFSHFDFNITSPRTTPARIRTLQIEHPHLKNRPTIIGHFDDFHGCNNNNNSTIYNGTYTEIQNGSHHKSKNDNSDIPKCQSTKSFNSSFKNFVSSHSLRRLKSKAKLSKESNADITKKNSEAPPITNVATNKHIEDANSQWTVWI